MRPAFTLIEVLVVIVVIGILVGLMASAVLALQRNARISGTKQVLAQLGNAIEAYRLWSRVLPREQGVTWNRDGTASWDAAFPVAHRERLSWRVSSSPDLPTGLLDLLELRADLRIPGESVRGKDAQGYKAVVDAWRTPIIYQRFDAALAGPLRDRALLWSAMVPIPGTILDRDPMLGYALYSGGPPGLADWPMDAAGAAGNAGTSPGGGWWRDSTVMVYRRLGE